MTVSTKLLFGRSVVVYVDNLQVTGLDCTFKVKKTISKEPNTCEVGIYNLNQHHRGQMKTKGAQITVLAGYGGTVQQIFSGAARWINHEHAKPDWVTKIHCGDGEQEFLFKRISQSFKAGTKWKESIREVAKALVKDPGNLVEKIAHIEDTFLNGHSVHGRAAAEFDRMLKGKNLEWSIQDGRLQLLGPGETNSDTVTVLNSNTGLLGSPEFGTPSTNPLDSGVHLKKRQLPPVLKVRSLLQPQLRPGSRIRVEGRSITGEFRVTEVTHSGDTAGEEWFTEVECTTVADSA